MYFSFLFAERRIKSKRHERFANSRKEKTESEKCVGEKNTGKYRSEICLPRAKENVLPRDASLGLPREVH